MDFTTYITSEMMVLIPVLYAIGMFLKSSKIPDKYIPFSLLAIGVISAIVIGGNYTLLGIVNGFVQGVLVSASAVFINQLVLQSNKEK